MILPLRHGDANYLIWGDWRPFCAEASDRGHQIWKMDGKSGRLLLRFARNQPPMAALSQAVKIIHCPHYVRAPPRKRLEMLPWLGRGREAAERIDAEAEALIGELGVEAYAEARRREYESSNDAIALRRNQVALAVAHKTGERIGLDTSTRLAMNAVFAPDREHPGDRKPQPFSQVAEGSAEPFQLQFISSAPMISDLRSSAGVRGRCNVAFPARTSFLRLWISSSRFGDKWSRHASTESSQALPSLGINRGRSLPVATRAPARVGMQT